MTSSVYFLLLILVFAALGIFASPFFFVPAAALLVFLLFSGPLLAIIRQSGDRRSVGTPSTSEAAYEPVADPDRPTG